MLKLPKLPIFLAIVFVLASCGKKTLLNETHTFEGGTWNRFEPAEFKVNVKNIDKPYIVSVTLRYDTTVLYEPELPLIVDFFTDSNELHNILPKVRLRNRQGILRGETTAKFCTVTDTIDRRRYYNHPGTYTYRLRQRTTRYDIHGVESITLTVQ